MNLKLYISVFLAIFYCAACTRSTPNSGNIKVRISKDDGTGNYTFQTVELKTIRDLRGMSGDLAVIRYGGNWNCQDSSCSTFDSQVNDNHAPNARFIDTGDFLVPADYKSLVMTTAMYHYEAIKEFYDTFKANEGLSFPNIVNVDVKVLIPVYGETYTITNNAFYLTQLDSFFLIPYEESDGVSIPLNGGILAHEYAHRIFNARVRRKVDAKIGANKFQKARSQAYLDHLPSGADGFAEKQAIDFGETVLGGFDEGIADFFAYAYTGNPNFMEPSFKNISMSSDRDLSKKKVLNMSEQEISDAFKSKTSSFSAEKLESHNLGSRIAHYLYVLSKDQGIQATEQMILDSYEQMANMVADGVTKKNTKFKDVLMALVSPLKTSAKLCDSTKTIFPKLVTETDKLCKKESEKTELADSGSKE